VEQIIELWNLSLSLLISSMVLGFLSSHHTQNDSLVQPVGTGAVGV
jgi:hypothetical protein